MLREGAATKFRNWSIVLRFLAKIVAILEKFTIHWELLHQPLLKGNGFSEKLEMSKETGMPKYQSLLNREWFRWKKQLQNLTVPRSIAKNLRKIKSIHLQIFADASNLGCSCVTIALINQALGTVKGLVE